MAKKTRKKLFTTYIVGIASSFTATAFAAALKMNGTLEVSWIPIAIIGVPGLLAVVALVSVPLAAFHLIQVIERIARAYGLFGGNDVDAGESDNPDSGDDIDLDLL